MTFEFSIPLSRDDLLGRTGVNHYAVEEVQSLRILPTRLQEAKNNLRTQGPTAVLTTFDTFYSILKQFDSVSTELREDAWELILTALQTHANGLFKFLEDDMLPEAKTQHLNTLKMNTYLVCQFVEIYEADSSDPTAAAIAKGRKKSKSFRPREGNLDWDNERDRAIRALLHVLQLSVHRLWDPPVVEDEFVTLVTNICYKMLENPNIAKVSYKTTRESIYHLLGIMVKRYNHGLGCSLKIIQLLQHFEHLASPMAQGVEIFVNKYAIKSVPIDILREIGRMDPKDLARDTSGTRAYAAFLVELSERIPSVLLPSIPLVLSLLDGESHSMRNSVLGVLGELIIRVLSKEGLDEQQKAARDQFLDKLEDHIHDVHAFTRSKTLQIWYHIVQEKALPLPRQHSLLEIVIGRLQDKSSQVRKYANQLTTALLRTNPFAAKLPVDELKNNYEKEKEKLDAMIPDKEETAQANIRRDNVDHWIRIENKLLTEASKHYERLKEKDDSNESENDNEELISEEETVIRVKSKIAQTIRNDNSEEAIKLYFAGKEIWPQDSVFVVAKSRSQESDISFSEEDSLDSDQKCEMVCSHLKEIYSGEYPIELAELSQSQEDATGFETELAKQQVLVQYLKDSLNFASAIQCAVPVICQLLGSKNVSDVLESIDFFVTSFEFGVSNVMPGVRRMLVLIWSKENGIKDAVVEAYRRLYLRPEGPNARAKALAVASNLTALTVGATMGDLTSLEELVCELVRSGDMDKKIIQVLWERFSMKIPDTTDEDSRAAIMLLAMAAGAEVEIVRSNIDVLVKEGLGTRGETDFLLTKYVCTALSKLGGTGKPKPGETEEPFRFNKDHEIFTRLAHIVVEGTPELDLYNWVPMAEIAINVIYKLSEHPDILCGDIIKQVAKIVISHQKSLPPAEDTPSESDAASSTGKAEAGGEKEEKDPQPSTSQAEDDKANSPQSEEHQTTEFRCSTGMITRLLSLAGQVALRQLVHLDVAVFGEMKRRHAVQQEESCKARTTSVTASTAKKNQKNREEEDDELGINGAVVEDAEAEYIRKLTEEEIVGTNLLALLKPMIVAVCKSPSKYPDPELRAAASLALAKYMMVSSQFCEAHLQLLFTILEKSPHSVIRANGIIALGDLTFRFPNLIEPWTSNLYARLRDTSPTVRKTTLMVLTHLILNDMIKVKGQISELATCIVDYDSRIAGLSKLFFNELAKKGNAIYNIMPDVISRLSDPDIGVDEEHFQIIMKYLFSFIQKDRQCESLVEKLCHRFRATINERQWRDLAFCLSLLSYSEKSIRKLIENFACYGDKLGEEAVFNCFVTITNGAKKFPKPETKIQIEELESRIEECHQKGMEDAEVSQKASRAAAAARGRGKKSPRRKGRASKARTPRRPFLSEEDDEDDEEFQPAKRSTQQTKKDKLRLSLSSEDELFDVKEELTEEVRQVSSDNENINPNITGEASPELIVKKRHKSVNSARQKEVSSTPRTRKSSRKAAVKYK